MTPKELHRIISLTFDSDPKVRKEAALKLAEVDDPGASFALLELTYDKDREVAETAKRILEEKSKREPKLLSLAEIFERASKASKASKKKKEETISPNSKVVEHIEKLLQKSVGKERAKTLKDKLLSQIFKDSYKERAPTRKEVVQEVLFAYLEELGGVEEQNLGSQTSLSREKREEEKSEESTKERLEEVGEAPLLEEVSSSFDNISSMRRELEEARDDSYFTIEYKGEKLVFDSSFKPVFEIALKTFLETDDERIVKKQLENLKKFYSKQIELAFRIAKEKTKKRKMVSLNEIRDGMRRIFTDLLEVLEVKRISYPRTKTKKDVLVRVLVRDREGNIGVLYLLDGRGYNLSKGMRIRVENGKSKYFSFSGETAIVISGKSSKVIAEF